MKPPLRVSAVSVCALSAASLLFPPSRSSVSGAAAAQVAQRPPALLDDGAEIRLLLPQGARERPER